MAHNLAQTAARWCMTCLRLGADARLRAVKIRWRTLQWAGAVLALALAIFGIDWLRFGGAFRSLQPRFAGHCRTIELGGSSEHMQLDRDRGLAYLSFLDRDSLARGWAVDGTVMLLDLNLAEPAPRAAMLFDPGNFRPQALSLFKRGSAPAKLFVVSEHPDGSHSVEIAEQGSGGGFFPREAVRDPAFIRPSAIVATGARGMAPGPDASRLYVAETLAKALRIYRRNPANGALILEEIVDLNTAPAGLDVDEDGVVWIAAHPRLRRPGPSQVLRFDPRQTGDSRLTQVYLNAGDEISGGAVAARWRDEFLIGALFDKKVLICKQNP
jgi:arylesterase/paraoxonase